MSNVIYKYTLEIIPHQEIEIPGFEHILDIAEQGKDICMWVVCDPEKEHIKVPIHIAGTGQEPPFEYPRHHIKTVVMQSSPFVWHVYFGDW